MLSTVASIDDFRAAPATGSGLGAADTASVTGVLLQGGSFGSFSPSEVGATSSAAFDVPACAVVATGKVTFNACRVTVSQSSGGTSTSGSVTVDGEVSLSADRQTLTWDLSYGIGITVSGSTSLAMSGALHSAGRVVATPTTAVGLHHLRVRPDGLGQRPDGVGRGRREPDLRRHPVGRLCLRGDRWHARGQEGVDLPAERHAGGAAPRRGGQGRLDRLRGGHGPARVSLTIVV